MAWTADDLVKIEAAIKSGHSRVRFADREVEYQTTRQLIEARTEIMGALRAQSGTKRKRMLRLFGSTT